jgi:hypothetical protein
MLAHRDNVIAFAPRAGVDHASLHSGAERADRVLLHAEASSFDESVTFNPVGHSNTFHVLDERLGLIFDYLRIHCHSANVKLDWCHRLEMLQDVDKAKTIFATTECHKYPVPIFDHLEVSDRRSTLGL